MKGDKNQRPAYDLTVIIPTFNEEENIRQIIESVDEICRKATIKEEILVVDDDSSDRTNEFIREMQARMDNLHLIIRESDHGLSQSVVEGFANAQAGIIQVIDADFSHPVELIPEFFRSIKEDGFDVAIGSRYTKGGDIEDWPLKRRIISLGATVFGRILFPRITDPVSGFFAIKRDVVAGADLKPRGYKILMEVLGKGKWKTATEIPFTFRDREEGESKLKLSIMLDYILQCADIGVYGLKTRIWLKLRR